MRARAVLVSIFASAGVLAIGWELGASASMTTIAASAPLDTGTPTGPSRTTAAVTPPAVAPAPTPTATRAATAPARRAPAPAAPAHATKPATKRPVTAAPQPAKPPPTRSVSSKDGTYRGQSVSTPYGNVQVQIRVSGGKITDVTALALTDLGSRSVQISNQAAPLLRQEVLQSQSANVSFIGGATYTSAGYLASVQSAIDRAGL